MPNNTRTEEALENSATFKRGVAALFDAAVSDWKPADLKALSAEIKRGTNLVEIREDGSLVASVSGRVIFTSTEEEVLDLGAFLEAGA